MREDLQLKLGISGWRLQGQRTGIGRYVLSMVEEFSRDLVSRQFSEINVYSPQALAGSGVHLPENVNNRVLASRLPMILWENLRLGPTASDDVVLYPSFSRPLVTRHATVVTTHDAHMNIVPELFTRRERIVYKRLYGWSARAATLVITTSEAAKRDVIRAWDVDPAKIRVTPLAAAKSFRPLGQERDRGQLRFELLGEDLPYFMFAGKISGRRNLPELLRAFAEFKHNGGRQKLVMAGPTYAMESVKLLAAEFGLGEALITFSFVSDEVLNDIYNCADAFITPSVYENGSLPVFEAQAAGTPVISVATEGTVEITGGEAILIPKLDVTSLVDAMTLIANDESLRADLSKRGLENSRRYSWQRCAAETLAVCSEAGVIGQR